MAIGLSGSNGGITDNVRKVEKRDLPLIRKVLTVKLFAPQSDSSAAEKTLKGEDHGSRILGQ